LASPHAIHTVNHSSKWREPLLFGRFSVWQLRALRRMANLHIGDSVTFRERAYLVRGLSPMGAGTRRVQLEDVETGEHIEIPADGIQRDRRSVRDDQVDRQRDRR
jgi:hypothetical protein